MPRTPPPAPASTRCAARRWGRRQCELVGATFSQTLQRLVELWGTVGASDRARAMRERSTWGGAKPPRAATCRAAPSFASVSYRRVLTQRVARPRVTNSSPRAAPKRESVSRVRRLVEPEQLHFFECNAPSSIPVSRVCHVVIVLWGAIHADMQPRHSAALRVEPCARRAAPLERLAHR